jgi:predicted ribosome quality control (RQC) complex YloA/Tae2 family protein
VPEFRKYQSSNGLTILVGKNSRDNNYLTLKIAQPNDIFFHASDFPGSHVILQQTGEAFPTREDLMDAACLAAYFSKGRDKKVTHVDYAEKSNVSKPRKAPAGLVELSKFKTLKIKKADRRISKYIKSELPK